MMTEAGIHAAPSSPVGPERATAFVSVVVPHFEDLERLDKCLAALERQTMARSAFEIIVADNNSPSGAAAVEHRIAGRAKLVVVTERGAGAARNGGVAIARGDILAFTDSDCIPEPAWLVEGVKSLAEHDFTGGRMEVLIDDPARMSGPEAFEMVFAFHNEAYVRRRGFTVTANMFCHRELFDKVGGFVASGVSEDWEWCIRARALGYRIGYAGAACVGHPARRTWPDLLEKWRRINVESYGLIMRDSRGRLYWAVRTLSSPLLAIAGTPKALFSPKLRGLNQRFAAIVTLYRIRFERFWDGLRLMLVGQKSRRTT
jgi:glycosyltransferase involved in cell wall biosynthesis